MKKFITIKKRKTNHQFIIYILLIIILSISINLLIIKTNLEKFYNLIIINTYGNILNKYDSHFFKELFLKNILGFNLNITTKAQAEKTNIKDLIIDREEPLIYIYNTYQTSKYKNNYYNSYTINPFITRASLILEEYLEEKGLNTLVETRKVAEVLNENDTEFYEYYKGSRILMEEALKNNKSLKYFFDIQMMEDNYEFTTTEYESKNYAQVIFIIGTDNPKYKENQKLAQEINNKLTNLEINISKGISLRGGANYQGYYNEDFSPNTLLIEVGGPKNSIDEVNRTLKILASAITEVIYEKEKK